MICLVLCLLASNSWAEWSEPVNLSEINYPTTAQFASLTADGLIISFIRNDFLMEAYRDDPSGPFTEQRIAVLPSYKTPVSSAEATRPQGKRKSRFIGVS